MESSQQQIKLELEIESLKQKVFATANQAPLNKYDLKICLSESIALRNLLYIATDKSDKSHVVIKFSYNKSLHQEYQAMINNLHPNIIVAKEFISTNDYYAIVMPRALGGDLFYYTFAKNIILESEIRLVMKSLLLALEYLHKSGLIHNDVKLENIFVMTETISSRTVLADLELLSNTPNRSNGTVSYFSPEYYFSFLEYIWAAGVVMYLLFYRVFPFKNKNFKRPIEFDDSYIEVSEEAKDLMQHLLSINPSERFTAEQALCHSWFNVKDDYHETVRETASILSNQIDITENIDSDSFALG